MQNISATAQLFTVEIKSTFVNEIPDKLQLQAQIISICQKLDLFLNDNNILKPNIITIQSLQKIQVSPPATITVTEEAFSEVRNHIHNCLKSLYQLQHPPTNNNATNNNTTNNNATNHIYINQQSELDTVDIVISNSTNNDATRYNLFFEFYTSISDNNLITKTITIKLDS